MLTYVSVCSLPTESIEDGAGAGSRPATASPKQGPPPLLSSLLSKDGASGPPFVSIGDVTCDPLVRPPAVSAGAVPMATSVG